MPTIAEIERCIGEPFLTTSGATAHVPVPEDDTMSYCRVYLDLGATLDGSTSAASYRALAEGTRYCQTCLTLARAEIVAVLTTPR